MYGKLIIFLTLTGCILIAAQSISTESANSTSSSSKAASSSSESTNSTNNAAKFANMTEIESTNSTTNATSFLSTTEIESTNSTANATKAANSTESESTNSTSTASNTSSTAASGSTNGTNNASNGSGTGQFPAWFFPPIQRPSRPFRPGFNRPQGIAGIPIISDFINAFRGIIPGYRHGPGGRRIRRSRASRAVFDTSNITGLFDGQSLPGFPGVPNMSYFQIPNADDIVSEIPELSDYSDLQISEISNLPRIPMIPGLQNAINEARERVADEISSGEDVVTAIQDAIQNGLSSSNPTEAIRGLVSTILKAYLAVARNCPLLIVGGYVMREGLFLTSEILRTMAEICGHIQDADSD